MSRRYATDRLGGVSPRSSAARGSLPGSGAFVKRPARITKNTASEQRPITADMHPRTDVQFAQDVLHNGSSRSFRVTMQREQSPRAAPMPAGCQFARRQAGDERRAGGFRFGRFARQWMEGLIERRAAVGGDQLTHHFRRHDGAVMARRMAAARSSPSGRLQQVADRPPHRRPPVVASSLTVSIRMRAAGAAAWSAGKASTPLTPGRWLSSRMTSGLEFLRLALMPAGIGGVAHDYELWVARQQRGQAAPEKRGRRRPGCEWCSGYACSCFDARGDCAGKR